MLGNYFKPENLILLKSPNVLPNDLDNAVNGGGVTLWHNLGGGRFENTTKSAGLADAMGWTLDVGEGDFDNDGRPDVYVAGDYGTDRVYFNNGDGTFTDATETAIGFDTRKGMNADVGDYDNDGWLDVYVTNITDEYMKECNMLWHNNGDRTFTDVSRETAHVQHAVGLGRQVRGLRQRRLARPLRRQRPAFRRTEELHPRARQHDHRARNRLQRRAQLAGDRRHDLERVPEEEVLPQPRRQLVQGDLGGRRRGQRARRPRPGGGGLRQGRPPGVLPDERQPGADPLPQRHRGGGRLDRARSGRHQVQPRRHRRARDAQDQLRADAHPGGGRRQRLRRPELPPSPLRARHPTQSRQSRSAGRAASASVSRPRPAGSPPSARRPRARANETASAATSRSSSSSASRSPGSGTGPPRARRPTRSGPIAISGRRSTRIRRRGRWRWRSSDRRWRSHRTRRATGSTTGSRCCAPARPRRGSPSSSARRRRIPEIPHTWFNLGIHYKKDSQYEKAIAQFEQMVKLVPGEPVSHYNLGYSTSSPIGRPTRSGSSRRAEALDPSLAGPHFQLYNVYREAGRTEDAAREQARFQADQKTADGRRRCRRIIDWSFYAEILRPGRPRRRRESGDAGAARVRRDPPAGHVRREGGRACWPSTPTATAGPTCWRGRRTRCRGCTATARRRSRTPASAGLKGVRAVAAGDVDNDGFPDLAVVTASGAALYTNANGAFTRSSTALPSGDFRAAVWLDFDHDYDLDLFLLGDAPVLLRNNGRAGFSDRDRGVSLRRGTRDRRGRPRLRGRHGRPRSRRVVCGAPRRAVPRPAGRALPGGTDRRRCRPAPRRSSRATWTTTGASIWRPAARRGWCCC